MAGLVGALSSGNRYADVGDGLFHLVPNPDTAAANGYDWNDVFWYGSDDQLPGSIGDPLADVDAPTPPPSPPPPPPTTTGPPPPTAGGEDNGAGAPSGTLAGLPGGDVYVSDGTVWNHIPDVATFNADGYIWNDINWVSGLPGPVGDPLPSVAGTPAPGAPPPTVANSTFTWGGRTWGPGDFTKFVGYLAAHGVQYATWAANHPDAAAIIEAGYPGANQEPLPKSLGEALQAYIAAGSTAAEAAAAAEALRAALVAQGVSNVTPAQLLQDAQVIKQTYDSEQGQPPPGGGVTIGGPPPPGTRQLQSVDKTQRGPFDFSNLPPVAAGYRTILNNNVTEAFVVNAALVAHADPWIMLGTCKTESGFNIEPGLNQAGAVGPMQVVGYPPYDGSVPQVEWAWGNLITGARLLAKYGSIYDHDQQKMSAAYNAGEGAVDSNWPGVLQWLEVKDHPEDGDVQDYVDKVGSIADSYQRQFGGGWNIDPDTGKLINGKTVTSPPPTTSTPPPVPAGVASNWRNVVGFWRDTVPASASQLGSAADSLTEVFK